MAPGLKRIGYAVYVIAATLFFLYALFPSEALTAYLSHRLSGGRPDVTVSIDRIEPVLPPGLRLEPVRYSHTGRPLFELSQLSVRPELMSLIGRGTVYRFEGRAYGGRVAGEAGPFDPETGMAQGLEAGLSAIRIEQIPALASLVTQKLAGLLEGRLTISEPGLLEADLSVAGARVQLNKPLIGLRAVNFDVIEAVLTFDGNRISLERCTLKGTEMDGEITGSIRLDTRAAAADLDLIGTLRPHHAFLAKIENKLAAGMLRGKDALGFSLTGPISAPAISFR